MNAPAFAGITSRLSGTRHPLLLLCLCSALASACVGPTGPSQISEGTRSPVSEGPPLSVEPSLLSPGDGAVLDNGCSNRSDGISWEFDWSDVQRATRYHLIVQHRGGTAPLINRFTSSSSYLYVDPTAYIIEGNRFDWEWKVDAEVDGVSGRYSQARTFSVEPLDADCRR